MNWEGTSRWRAAVTKDNVNTINELFCKVHASHYPIVIKLEMKGLHETWNHFNCRNGVSGPTFTRSARVWSFKLHSIPTNKCIYIHLSFCVERYRPLLSISKRSNYVIHRIYSRSVKKNRTQLSALCSSRSATGWLTFRLYIFYCNPFCWRSAYPLVIMFKNLARLLSIIVSNSAFYSNFVFRPKVRFVMLHRPVGLYEAWQRTGLCVVRTYW